MNFKNINVGKLIKVKVAERNLEMSRICNFFKISDKEVEDMYSCESLDSIILLKWSKLLEYDLFRLYSQHLILYAPATKTDPKPSGVQSVLPEFRKNIYTVEIIEFILGRIKSNEMTKNQVIERYKIPKTTLYKWIAKNRTSQSLNDQNE
ncbi:transposase [Chryseobacterium viscerum]|uniref:Transposase n=1 Tax=Chryseobacterium viscerum TaxID=1037377 RepID=A0A316WAJ8_9FLAO|nr:transposase [Chryseobacterium viscerum]PWN58402.1 transposase [Chryseobacterium viscerum]